MNPLFLEQALCVERLYKTSRALYANPGGAATPPRDLYRRWIDLTLLLTGSLLEVLAWLALCFLPVVFVLSLASSLASSLKR